MKLEEGHLNNNAANDDALSEVTAQRNSTMAEVARLRNESAQRTREAAELQNKVDSLTMELSDVKRQLRDAQRQLQQFREQKTTGNLNSETLVVDLCTPEPENRPAKFEVPAQGSTSSDDKVSIPSKRRNSDISTQGAPVIEPDELLLTDTSDSEDNKRFKRTKSQDLLIVLDTEDKKRVKRAKSQDDDIMIASNQPPDRHPTVPPSAPSTSKAESPSHLNDANQPGTRFIQSSDSCRSHFRFKKEEVIALSPSFAAPHLEALPPFPVDDSKATHTAKVSREFLTDVFGGQRFTLFAYMSKCGYTKRPVVYPNWKYNPLLPGASGFPGLVFALLAEFFEQPAFSVFVPVQETPALWSYRGEYRFAISGPLPPEEFNIQTDEVKNTWADMIRNNVLHHVYRELRARVYLRKAHIPINAESVEAESQRIHSRKGGGVTQADILAALSSGEEMISILSMTCIDFDYRFNDLISRKRKSWKSRPTKRW